LLAPELERGVPAAQLRAGSETQERLAFGPGGEELADRRQVLLPVLQGRPRERPRAPSRKALALPAHLGVAGLDLLRLVQHDDVPEAPPRRRRRVLREVLTERLVADQVDVRRCRPLAGPLGRGAPDRA